MEIRDKEKNSKIMKEIISAINKIHEPAHRTKDNDVLIDIFMTLYDIR